MHCHRLLKILKQINLRDRKFWAKIELPVGDEARTKPEAQRGKRKRKRIPIEKKDQQQSQQTAQERAQHLFKKREPGQQGGQGGHHGGGGHHHGGQGQQGGGQHRQGGGQQGGGNFRGGGNRPNQRHGGGGGNRHVSREPKEINEKEIQDKIRETQAKLSAVKAARALKQNAVMKKRQGMIEREGVEGQDNKPQVTEFISVSELANLMDVSFAEVIEVTYEPGPLWYLSTNVWMPR